MLRIYTLNDSEEWDRIVQSFREYDVYHLSGYVKGFYAHGDGEPLLIYFSSEPLKAIQVVMRRRISDNPCFSGKVETELYDLITPYGYGGWLLEGRGSVEQMMAEYNSWCKKNHIVSEFIRFHPVLRNQKAVEDYYEVVPLGATVAMDVTSLQTIWDNLTSKTVIWYEKPRKTDCIFTVPTALKFMKYSVRSTIKRWTGTARMHTIISAVPTMKA